MLQWNHKLDEDVNLHQGVNKTTPAKAYGYMNITPNSTELGYDLRGLGTLRNDYQNRFRVRHMSDSDCLSCQSVQC